MTASSDRTLTGGDRQLGDVTRLLMQWQSGDTAAFDDLVPLVYEELRRIARGHLRREAAGHLLQPTALVHEVYLRLARMGRLKLGDRRHLLALAGRLMRQVLVDHARRRRAQKRDTGRGEAVAFAGMLVSPPPDVDVLALDMALDELGRLDPRQRDLVELRFFLGLSIEEAARALGMSHATAERDWCSARAWLSQQLSPTPRG